MAWRRTTIRPPVPQGKLRRAAGAPEIPLEAACEITGGEPLAWLGEIPVAASVRHGAGVVTAIGFGALFNDANMGFHWLQEPDAETRQRDEVLYALLRASLPSQPRPGPALNRSRCPASGFRDPDSPAEGRDATLEAPEARSLHSPARSLRLARLAFVHHVRCTHR